MASAEASATVMKKSWTPKSTSDKASQILAAVNRHGDKESPVIVFLPGWQERWQVEKALKKKRVSVNVIGNEDEDVIETTEDDDRVVVLSTIIGTRSVTLPFQNNDSAEND